MPDDHTAERGDCDSIETDGGPTIERREPIHGVREWDVVQPRIGAKRLILATSYAVNEDEAKKQNWTRSYEEWIQGEPVLLYDNL